LAGIIQQMSAGSSLDDHVSRAFARLGHQMYAPGISTSWVGAQQLIETLTTLGYFVELQAHSSRCLCRILRLLKGNAISKQMASTEGSSLPEAVAKAALLTLLETEPPS